MAHWRMASSLRSRLALIALIGLFLIPLLTSSLNGLTHVVTCKSDSHVPFVVNVAPDGAPTITSAESFDRSTAPGGCAGVALAMAVVQRTPSSIRVLLPITNRSRFRWHGSVHLLLGATSVPVGVGTILPGQTRTSHVDLDIGSATKQITGSLLIGP
jgi:hypothetical protein